MKEAQWRRFINTVSRKLTNHINNFKIEISKELLPRQVMHYLFERKPNSMSKSYSFKSKDLDELKNKLKIKLNTVTKKQPLTLQEEQIVDQIKTKTRINNRNNITRTKAYVDYYRSHPEIHWAFLAHMVSRNGGWNMTDLKGALLPRLMDKREIEQFFQFLERCNWLIFQDAYPQLLLYEESKKQQKNLFHLLPYLDISKYMEVIWNWFWNSKNSMILTYALITNEQNYIELRVIQNPYYQKNVLENILFKIQSFLHLNHVVLPYIDKTKNKIRLAGTTVEHFGDLQERIKIGKILYSMLFSINKVFTGATEFSNKMIHTGSREDYWPNLFTSNPEKNNYLSPYVLHLSGDKLHLEAEALYSPRLEDVWEDILDPKPTFTKDWCTNIKILNQLEIEENIHAYDLTDEYLFTLNKIELAILAKEKLLRKEE